MKKVILKNGLKVKVTNDEVELIVRHILDNPKGNSIRIFYGEVTTKFFKVEEIVAII